MSLSTVKPTETRDAIGKPLIGIGAHLGRVKTPVLDTNASLVPQMFVDRVVAAGCTPVLLPPSAGIECSLDRLDGLLLIGGPDVGPASYSAEPHPKTVPADPRRDVAELALLAAAIDAGLPILGSCRGVHILNVVRGGTLHQHLPDLIGHDGHSPGREVYGERPPQRVRVEPDSRLAKILGANTATVPCYHHQAIDRLGAGLTVTAWSADQTVEAVELTGHPFAIAVQWHVEESEHDGLFLALAEAARDAHRLSASRA